MALVAGIDVEKIEPDKGFIVHTREGGWRGRCLRNEAPGGEIERMMAVGTWLPAEAIADAAA